MYKSVDKTQPAFLDFNQPLGLEMNPENRWIIMARSNSMGSVQKKIYKVISQQYWNMQQNLYVWLLVP